jgi:four helix bundle protein
VSSAADCVFDYPVLTDCALVQDQPLRRRAFSYRDLEVWQVAMQLVSAIYEETRRFPPVERYGLAGQMQRAAVSVAANIAEGHGRLHRGEYLRFVSVANGSLKETETEILLAAKLGYIDSDRSKSLLETTESLSRMLGALIRKLRQPTRLPPIPNP